ncbi:hypothetical protein ACEQ8H_006466 [Pleosporales sp. CAS-2024a]
MSQLGGLGATPARRSARISQAGSVTGQSVVTTATAGGTKQRKKGPLTKVKSRKSNAYGASGRVGAAEELAVSATGFAQAFQSQRGKAAASDDEDDLDELAAETPRMSGALNGHSSSPQPDEPSPPPTGFSYMDSEDFATSEMDTSASFANTSKSFGPVHETGMLFRHLRQNTARSPSVEGYVQPQWQLNRNRRLQSQLNAQAENIQTEPVRQPPPKQATPAQKSAMDQSVNELIAEEQSNAQHHNSFLPQNKPRKQSAQQAPASPHLDEWLGNVESETKDGQQWFWQRKFNPIFWIMLTLFALIALSGLIRLGVPDKTGRPGLGTVVCHRMSNLYYDLSNWYMPGGRPEKVWFEQLEKYRKPNGDINADPMWLRIMQNHNEYNDRFKALDGSLDEHKGRFKTMDEAIDELRNHLPDFMVVRVRADGKAEVTDEFWHALIGKAKSAQGEAEWNDFLKATASKIEDIFGGKLRTSPTEDRPAAFNREEFLNVIRKHYDTMSHKIEEDVRKAILAQEPTIKAIARTEAKQAMINSIQLNTLAVSNLVKNFELNLQKTNYFSPGLGAVVVPDLTSATYLDERNTLAIFRRRLPLSRQRNPPKAALDTWQEPGDCWCAAPNPGTKGAAQLTIALPRPVFPQQVTIEHVPMTMMPAKKITTAPRSMELWVETDQPAQYQFSHRQGECLDGPVGWTCLGSFRYNIHASNHQQTFDLDAQSSVPVHRAMIRVTSNWGADHTCLYRVRLHGKDADEDHQYSVHLNDAVQ